MFACALWHFILMRRLTHLIILAAFVFSCGGQWYVLQGVAWIKMIHDYSQVVSFTEAVSMTISGKYPCEICRAIDEKKQAADDKLCSLEKFEKKFFPPATVAISRPAPEMASYSVKAQACSTRTEPPPTPPPRFVLV